MTGTVNVKNFNLDVSATGSLLSGGFKIDFSSGIDVKVGLGPVGFGVSVTASHDKLGDLLGADIK